MQRPIVKHELPQPNILRGSCVTGANQSPTIAPEPRGEKVIRPGTASPAIADGYSAPRAVDTHIIPT